MKDISVSIVLTPAMKDKEGRENPRKKGTPDRRVVVISNQTYVRVKGVEPSASSSRTTRATKLRHTRWPGDSITERKMQISRLLK